MTAHPDTGGGDWLRQLPPVRGRLAANAPIGHLTWFRVGGSAELLFRPADEDDLAGFLAALPAEIPVTAIGVGSNLLVRDGGIPGVTIRLGRGFVGIETGADKVSAGAGALDANVALAAAQAGIAGLEFLSGVPGTVGGGFRTNAGAYGSEFKDVLISADRAGHAGQKLDSGFPTAIPAHRRIGSSPARFSAGHQATASRLPSAWRKSRPRAKPRSRSGRAPAAPPSPTRPAIRPGS